jgi:hypothetical protein
VKLKLKGRTKNNTKKIWKRAIRATIKTKKKTITKEKKQTSIDDKGQTQKKERSEQRRDKNQKKIRKLRCLPNLFLGRNWGGGGGTIENPKNKD